MGCYDKAVLRQHLLLSMVLPYGIILRHRLLPLPHPCLFLCRLLPSSNVLCPSSAARHPLPAFAAKFAAQSSQLLSSSPPAHVTLFAALPSDLSHHPPPAVHAATSPPPSLLQPAPHPDRSCCAVRISLPALVTLSARRHYCHHDPLLAPTTLVTPSAARARRAVLPPELRHHPHRCCCDAPMQKS